MALMGIDSKEFDAASNRAAVELRSLDGSKIDDILDYKFFINVREWLYSRVIWGVLPPVEDPEDLVSVALVKYISWLRHKSEIPVQGGLRKLQSIARNLVHDQRKKSDREPKLVPLVFEVAVEDGDVLDESSAIAFSTLLDEFLEFSYTLDEKYQRVANAMIELFPSVGSPAELKEILMRRGHTYHTGNLEVARNSILEGFREYLEAEPKRVIDVESLNKLVQSNLIDRIEKLTKSIESNYRQIYSKYCQIDTKIQELMR